MKVLDLIFKSNQGKLHTLKLNYVNENLAEATVKQAMEQISQSELFKKGDEIIYATPIKAKYVTTTDNPVTSF
ncbi:MAG: DUF2922 domain-containing protein [Limosilactobacillus sp.]|nr:DUF2922 domain-containing protein [Limosilactobacillus sp.]